MGFYSILPALGWPKASFKRIARFAPIIGLLIGLVQSIVWQILNFFDWPTTSIALIVIALNAWLTGGLHLDGLIDTADGFAAGRDRSGSFTTGEG